MKPCLVLLVMVLAAGCSSGDKCSKACKKIERCYGDAGGAAPACTFSAACSPREECQARCILDADCAAIMQQAPSLVQCMAACASVPTGDTGIVIPEGGTYLDLGPSPEGGMPDFYVPPPDYGGPQPDVYQPSGPPRAKFCNGLVLNNQSFTATLKLGTAPNQWVVSAYSDECQPVPGISCPVIPTMSNPTVELTDGTQTLISGTINVTIQNDQEWLFIATVDSSQQATVQAGQFRSGYACTDDPLVQP